ncbi:MAG: gamma-glutamylcyclotransferase [Pseudomonadota bacterium]
MKFKHLLCGVALGALSLVWPQVSHAQDACHPSVDESKPQFIVGYGSLMEEASKRRSAPNSGFNHPVHVTGFQRAWNTRGNEIGFSTTYLGVDVPRPTDLERRVADSSAVPEMVAAIYQNLDPKGMTAVDGREAYYCRYPVQLDQVRLLDGWQLPEDAQIWIYALKPEDPGKPPTERWPIVQSYVDIFLTGCLNLGKRVTMPLDGTEAAEESSDATEEYAKTFAAACITTTRDWSGYWVNDRIYPRRPFIYQSNASDIDKLLSATEPTSELFSFIRIE